VNGAWFEKHTISRTPFRRCRGRFLYILDNKEFMSKKKKKTRNHKLVKKLSRKFERMDTTFVDANVFLDAMLDSEAKALKFFSGFNNNRKLAVTSTHAIGEVVRKVYAIAHEESGKDGAEYQLDKTIAAFRLLIDSANIKIENFDDKTKELVARVMGEDTRIRYKDALHVALGHQLSCKRFCTSDTGINTTTLKRFGMKRISP
jgi:predicted nucleic acid-binding protein